MSMVVTVNGVPQKGRLELKLTEAGNYSITSAVMTPLEDKPLEDKPPEKPAPAPAPATK